MRCQCRGSDRRRPGQGERGAWQNAAVDVLETQFGYSKDSLQEMLDLHGGNLEVALDMLAQLEAENEGRLSANSQVRTCPLLVLLLPSRAEEKLLLISVGVMEVPECQGEERVVQDSAGPTPHLENENSVLAALGSTWNFA